MDFFLDAKIWRLQKKFIFTSWESFIFIDVVYGCICFVCEKKVSAWLSTGG